MLALGCLVFNNTENQHAIRDLGGIKKLEILLDQTQGNHQIEILTIVLAILNNTPTNQCTIKTAKETQPTESSPANEKKKKRDESFSRT